MDLVGDQRGQSVQVGAVLLFAVLIVAFSSYQAFVVPDQNRAVEFDHSQRVQSQMQELRNVVVSATGRTSARAISVALGTQYPSRAVAVNPGPPTGSLRTVGTTDGDVTFDIDNTTATGDADDYWDGTLRQYNTGGIVYAPNYNLYTNAPTTVYEHTVVYNEFRSDSLPKSGQVLVDGRDISIVTLNGSLSRTSAGTASVDVRPVSTSERSIDVENTGGRINLSFRSRLDNSTWEELLDSEYDEADGDASPDKYVANISATDLGNGLYRIDLLLEPGTYDLRMTKVGVGTKVRSEEVSYLTNVTTNDTSATAGEATTIVVEARDRYNNPTSGQSVNATSNATGALASTTATTGDDGRVAFTFNASSAGTYRVRTSLDSIGGDYAASGQRNVTVIVEVKTAATGGGGGGNAAYGLDWQNPQNTNDNTYLSDCDDTDCTWDVGKDSDAELNLLSQVSGSIEGLTVEFAVNNTTVGTVSPNKNATDSDGTAGMDLRANENGTVAVYAASGGASDVINLTVENVTGPRGPTVSTADGYPVNGNRKYNVEYEASDPNGDLENVTVLLENSAGENLDKVEVLSPSEPQEGSVSGTVELQHGNKENPAQIRVIARDATGLEDSKTDTDLQNQN